MRWFGILTRIVGWLLTPLVVWAASFFGAWLLLNLGGQFANPRHAVYVAFATALIAGVASLWLWMQLLRRSPRLRHSLHVDPEGLPVIDEAAEAEAEAAEAAEEAATPQEPPG
jgi:hypothetical protein